jgi:hypothetical protein
MLRVTVELVPGGDERRAKTIARMTIANITRLADISDYEFTAHEHTNPVAATPARETHGTVRRHDRRQTVWSLVGKAAQAAAGG